MTSTTVIHIDQSPIDAINATVNAWKMFLQLQESTRCMLCRAALMIILLNIGRLVLTAGLKCIKLFSIPDQHMNHRWIDIRKSGNHLMFWQLVAHWRKWQQELEAGVLFSTTDHSILVKWRESLVMSLRSLWWWNLESTTVGQTNRINCSTRRRILSIS